MGHLFDCIRDDLQSANISLHAKNGGNIGNKEGKSEVSDGNSKDNSVTSMLPPEGNEASIDEVSPRKCWICDVTCRGNKLRYGEQYEYRPDFAKLLEAGIDALNTDICLPAAFFLHAMETVRSTEDKDFEEMGRRFVPHWRKRLEKPALDIVGREIRARLANLKKGSS